MQNPPTIQLPGGELLTANPRELYEAREAQRDELVQQLNRLIERRDDAMRQLRNDQGIPAIERSSIEQHITDLNGRIILAEQQVRQAELSMAQVAAVPGAVEIRTPPPPETPIENALNVALVFVLISLAIVAIGGVLRVFRRKARPVVVQVPSGLEQRFARLEHSLDAVAIEIERVAEGQRHLTGVFSGQAPRP